MEVMEKVAISDIVRDLELNVIYQPKDKEFFVKSQDVNRTGLALAGYFEYFSYDRIQIIGKGEYTYFKNIDKERRREILDKLFSYDIPALVMTRGLEVDEDIIDAAKRHERVLISSERNTTRFINKISNYLDHKLAPRVTIHGVLVDVYGIGVLIKGESSIGKSETALELIQRGHRLVADDAVEIIKLDDDRLVGQAPELLRHYMEIRGIGIIDVTTLYGLSSVVQEKEIKLVMHFEHWKDDNDYDRLGIDNEYMNILGIDVKKLTVPVRPGRNIAVIIEADAVNYRY